MIGLVIGVGGVAVLNAVYEHPIDEVTTAMSVLVVVGYVLGRVTTLLITRPDEDVDPIPKASLPFLVCMAFTVICIIGVVVISVSAGIYLALDLSWAVSLAGSAIVRLVIAAAGGVALALLCLLIQIGIKHQVRLRREIQDAFWIVSVSLRFPHRTLRHRF